MCEVVHGVVVFNMYLMVFFWGWGYARDGNNDPTAIT